MYYRCTIVATGQIHTTHYYYFKFYLFSNVVYVRPLCGAHAVVVVRRTSAYICACVCDCLHSRRTEMERKSPTQSYIHTHLSKLCIPHSEHVRTHNTQHTHAGHAHTWMNILLCVCVWCGKAISPGYRPIELSAPSREPHRCRLERSEFD